MAQVRGARRFRGVENLLQQNFLTRLMEEAGGNVSRAARIAGKERRALGKLLKKYGIRSAGGDAPE